MVGKRQTRVYCFKEGKKTEAGSQLLANQTKLIYDTPLDINPFLITEDDTTDATPQENIISEDDIDLDDIV